MAESIKDNISKNIAKFRKEKGLSQKELAEIVGAKNLTTISSWERGISSPDADTLILLCKLFGISLYDLYDVKEIKVPAATYTEEQKELINKYNALDAHGKDMVDTVLKKECERMHNLIALDKPSNLINLKYSSCKASAGTGAFLFDDCTDEDITVQCNEYTRLADICICVTGDSMEPKFSDGDILLVRNQPAIEEGEYGIFIKGDQGYVKKRGSDRLISLNPEYADIYPESEGIYCYGKVIGKLENAWIVG